MRPNPVHTIICVRAVQASLLLLTGHILLHWPLTGPHAAGLWLTAGLCAYFVFVFVGHWTWGLPIVKRLPNAGLTVALTFDDGPTDTTVRILDILQAHGATATFFVLGTRAGERPDVVRRIVSDGHTLGLHGYSHAPYVLKTPNGVRRDMERVRDAVRWAAPDAAPVVWVRPPHGFKTVALPFLLRAWGFEMAAWSVNSRDYQLSDAALIARRVLAQIRPGSVVLLHDGAANGATADALPLILEGLRERGWTCAGLPYNSPPVARMF